MAGHPKCPACHGRGEFQDSEDGGHWVQCNCAENIYAQFAAAVQRATEAEAKCGLLAALWTGHARTSREEAARIRQTVKVATEAEVNCNIRAEVWERCAEQIGNPARAQAVAEVLDTVRQECAGHEPRAVAVCTCALCKANAKLAALDVKEEKPRG